MCRIGKNFLHISFILQKLYPILCQTCVGKFMFGKHDIKEILLLVQCDVKVRDKQLHSIPNTTSALLQLVSV